MSFRFDSSISEKVAVISFGLVCICSIIYGFYFIYISKSSTSAIGYIYLPFVVILTGIIGGLAAWSISIIVKTIQSIIKKSQKSYHNRSKCYLAIVIISLLLFVAVKIINRQKLLDHSKNSIVTESELSEMCTQAISMHDVELLPILVANTHISDKLLEKIYSYCTGLAFNEKGLSFYNVFLALANNSATPVHILRNLSMNDDVSIRISVATNPNTPPDVLFKLSHDKNELVRTWVSTNPNITEQILLKLKNDPNNIVRSYAESAISERSSKNSVQPKSGHK